MTYYFTRHGFDRYAAYVRSLEDELSRLESLIGDTAETGGGWHDNGGLDHLNYDIRVADRRLVEARQPLVNASIIRYPATADTVMLGTAVELAQGDARITYQIVGYGESDVEGNKILYKSPLASALMGKREGESFFAEIAGKKVPLRILSIRPLTEPIPHQNI